MRKQKILYFMPDNPVIGKAGNITRLKQTLSYFNENTSLEVDFVSLIDWGSWEQAHRQIFKQKYPNIKLFLLCKKYKKQFFKYLFLYKIPHLFRSNLLDLTSWILRKEFTQIVNAKKYDKIVISYASWGSLVKNIKYNPYLILDTHDFITGQNRNKKNQIGKSFQSEMQILNHFDEIWTYSVEEEYIFGQFTDKKVTLIPISFPYRRVNIQEKYKYDVLFVGSNNRHNVMAMQWFIKEVLPYLDDIKIHVIGRVCFELPDNKNIIKYGEVNNLDSYYQNAKIAICPMLSGTGVKIKVLEALSYGLPVVTQRRGIDGLINKSANGCIVCHTTEEFASQIKKLITDMHYFEIKKQEAYQYYIQNHTPEIEKKILDTVFN